MKNEQLIQRAIATIRDNSSSYVIGIVQDEEIGMEIYGRDQEIKPLLERLSAKFIDAVLEDYPEVDTAIADALDELLDELGFGGEPDAN